VQFIGDWREIQFPSPPLPDIPLITPAIRGQIEQRKNELAQQAKDNQASLLAYLDCGTMLSDYFHYSNVPKSIHSHFSTVPPLTNAMFGTPNIRPVAPV
jgi:hypothetical protein